MAHVQKYTAGSVNGLSIHFDRKTTNHSNKDIDIERSQLNYDLRNNGDGLDTRSRMEKRLKEVYCMKRSDVKPMAVWVLTLPEELKEKNREEQKVFFKVGYKFMLQRYGGEKNVLSANVHNDETTPHMHFAFMPVVWDEKKQREKVSAKEILNRKDLRTFHQDLDVFLKQEIPHIYQEGILNEKTIDIENVKELKKMSDEIKRIKKELVIDFKFYGEPKEALKKVESSVKNTIFGDRVSLPSRDYEQLKKLALSTVGAKHVLDRVRETSDKKIERLETSIERANKQVENLEIQVRSLKRSEQLLKHEVEKSEEYREDSIIYESMLRDAGIDTELFLLEREAYLMLHKFENGYEPKDQRECKKWLYTLESNKEAKIITSKRLEVLIAYVKAILDRLLGKGQELSSDGLEKKQESLKRQSERNEKEYTPKKNKSRGIGR